MVTTVKTAAEAGDKREGQTGLGQSDDVFGYYNIEEIGRWALCSPQPGNLLVAELPHPFADRPGMHGAFLVKDCTSLDDGSLP